MTTGVHEDHAERLIHLSDECDETMALTVAMQAQVHATLHLAEQVAELTEVVSSAVRINSRLRQMDI